MKQNHEAKFETITYSAESKLNNPVKLFKAMLHDLMKSKELAWRLFVRDVSARYRQSIFGILWAFLPAIASGLVFIILQSKKVVNFGTTDIPYPVFVLVGTTLWQVFVDSLIFPLKTVTASKAMLAKINFPREALILSSFYDIVLNALIKFLVILGIFFIFKVPLTPGFIPGVFAILMLILLGLSLGLLLTPLGLLYTDVSMGLTFVTQFWFFVTPVVYPPPQRFPYSLISILNPVSPILSTVRDLLTKGGSDQMIPFMIVGVLSCIVFLFAWLVYRLALPIIIERMSA
ncbi:ABC transporter permease [Desulfobacter postgatei]|uniref:ABC transporter permease n=1 Tax=Desulfobacter postgatei TaxID=2293 RepID=UPI00259BEA25|nr:ABC transporter permease [uncultured Desulfobacter sp.]